MPGHTLARSTRTVEMMQVVELNARLEAFGPDGGGIAAVTAEFLGLTGAEVRPRVIDRAAAAAALAGQPRPDDVLALPAKAVLRGMIATGAPSYPYVYGIFGEPGAASRQLPVLLHTPQLQRISDALQLRGHRWGL